MKERFKSAMRALRRPRYGIPAVIILLIVFVGVAKAAGGKKAAFVTIPVARGSVVQEVDATGSVKSAQAVDLGFETGGKVAALPVKVGDRVKAGAKLAQLSNADAAANLASAQARLSSLEAGARPEDIAVSAASVASAQAALSNDAVALANAVNDAFVKADDAVRNHADTLYRDPKTSPSFGVSITSGGTSYFLDAPDAATNARLENERRQVEAILDAWTTASADATISARAHASESDLGAVQNLLNDIATVVNGLSSPSSATSDIYASYKADIAAARTSVSAALSSLRAAEQAYSSAQSALDVAQKQQDLKQAPATSQDLEIQRAAVETAQAAYNKTVITAPFDGLITAVAPQVGEIVSPNAPVVSIISDSELQVEVSIPESDIPKVMIGASADVTFDAYGKDFVATTSVVSIDPAATVIEGVPTYRTVLAFTAPDPRIKSGLTANITIHGDSRENVIAVPQRAVIMKGDQKIVEVVVADKEIDTPVETGLRGSDGNIEITSGLSEGQEIVPSPAAVQ